MARSWPRLVVSCSLALGACAAPDLQAPLDRASDPPPLRAPSGALGGRWVPNELPPSRTPLRPPVDTSRLGERPPPNIRPLENPPPAPWPRDAFGVVGARFAPRVVFGVERVGLSRDRAGLVTAYDRSGGIFGTDRWGRLQPLVSPLPPVDRVVQLSDVVVACPSEGQRARFSLDHGRAWGELGFSCAGRGRQISGVAGHAYALLADGSLRVGPVPSGPIERVALPFDDAEAVGAGGEGVVVFSADAVAFSEDEGRSFTLGRRPSPHALDRVLDLVFLGKSVVVAVGEAQDGGSPIIVSRDAGQTWKPVQNLPAAARSLFSISANSRGELLVLAESGDAALIGRNSGRDWGPVAAKTPRGVSLGAGPGFVAGDRLQMMVPIGEPTARIGRGGLLGPLWDVVYLHPRLAFGIGLEGGLLESRDGGVSWAAIPGTETTRFADLARTTAGRVIAIAGAQAWVRDVDGWRVARTPFSGQAAWVRCASDGEACLFGSDTGELAVSLEGGLNSFAVDPLPWPAGVAGWIDETTVVVVAEDGEKLAVSADSGQSWWFGAPPAADLVGLHGAAGTLFALSANGRLWGSSDGVEWRQIGGTTDGLPADSSRRSAQALYPLRSGAVLVLEDDTVSVVDGMGERRRLLLVPDMRTFSPTGDGGIIALGWDRMVLFEAR